MNTERDMDDAEIKRLREEQVEWADVLGDAQEVKATGETLLMASPNNLLLRFVVWMMDWVHSKCVVGEERARVAARRTYDV